MVRRYRRSIFDELDDMRTYMEYLMGPGFGPVPSRLSLPSGEIIPAVSGRQDLKVDVEEKEDEVVITADLYPGINKEDVTLDLIKPQALEITCKRKKESEAEKEGYFMRERYYGSVSRVIPLPVPVTQNNAKANLKDGVLEIHLKKAEREETTLINIE